ncbi:unnamed protein product [Gongylonema pulchrum]|uniref:Dynein heavy chain tail domain-containing protein n=1 Tax=Gongylonema pulchrum TaxID=637853 RepID=A0A3P7NK85_9BILA|nr:unnamed protein product [Gongylonema pulchrum]
MKLEGDNFRQKLNTQHIFDDWVARVQAKNISLTGRVFIIEKRQKDGKIALNLKVNFSNDVRNMKHMGFRIPLKIVNTAHQANLLYPFAISLLESGNLLTWESYKMDPYVSKLSTSISSFQEKVEELDMLLDRIEVILCWIFFALIL